MLCALAMSATSLFAGAANDNFANAQTLPGSSGTVTGDLTGATLEGGENNHAFAGFTRSVWFKFTMPQNGGLVLTVTSNGNKGIAVYSGNSVNTLTPLQNTFGITNTSLVATSLTAGTQYHIAVASTSGTTFSLSYSVPINDNFANAIALSGASGVIAGSTRGSTTETNEPFLNHTVWYSWTVPSAGDVEIDVQSVGQVVAAAYTGSAVNALHVIVANGAGPLRLIGVAANTVIHVQVGASTNKFYATMDDFTLFYEVFPVPANDNFADAITLDPTGDGDSSSNLSSTVEAGEPAHSGSATAPFRSLWYSWVVPANGNIKIYVTGDFDTELGVYTGSAVNALTAVGKNDDVGTSTSQTDNSTDSGVSLSNVAAGTILRIAVGAKSFTQLGDFDLTTEFHEIGVATPANDDFDKAEVVTLTDNGDGTFSSQLSGENAGAGAQTGEPTHSLLSSAAFTSIWYKITMPIAGGISFSQDSDDLRMAAYVGNSVGTLTSLGRGSASLSLSSVAQNTVIFLAVDGRNLLDSDLFNLSVEIGAAPKNDNFANAEVLQTGSVDGTTQFATTEAGDPTRKAVWYTWTLPASGIGIIECDQPVKVFTGTQLTALNPVFLERPVQKLCFGLTFGENDCCDEETVVKRVSSTGEESVSIVRDR